MNGEHVPTIAVRIAPDGMCSIDGDYFAPPPGAPLHQAVLDHLQLEAAALETPVTALITDEQANYAVTICVNLDGTSQPAHGPVDERPQTPKAPQGRELAQGREGKAAQPPSAPLKLERPYESLPEPYCGRLKAAGESVARGHTADAASSIDQIITELSTTMGPRHLSVIAAGLMRGDITLIDHDYQYGLRIWAFIAQAWQELAGPQDLLRVPMVGNAVWCWSQLPPAEAVATYATITTLLQTVHAPGSDQALQNVNRRQQLLTADDHTQE